MSKVDRSYSRFKEIREYQDRAMMKWQGFFLSEHTKAMQDDNAEKVYYSYLVRGILK